MSFAPSSAESKYFPLKILGAPDRLGLSPGALPVPGGLFLELAKHSIGIQCQWECSVGAPWFYINFI